MEGCHLSLNELNKDRLKETIEECEKINPSINIYSESFDVSDAQQMSAFAQNTLKKLKQVDLMINNAGVAIGEVKAEELKKEDFDWIMGINFWGMVYGTQSFVPHLKLRKESALVNISSLFGLVGIAYQAAYCTTKFAIRGFTESLRMETLHDSPHLTIHTVHPGGVSTRIATDSKWVLDGDKPNGHDIKANELLVMPPPKAAKIIINGVKQKKSRILVGNDAIRASWIQRIWPEKYSKLILKQLNDADLTKFV
jgi:butyryl-CoA dehydrogenase